MSQDRFNLSIRIFLKQFGVMAQREIERAVQHGIADGTRRGDEACRCGRLSYSTASYPTFFDGMRGATESRPAAE